MRSSRNVHMTRHCVTSPRLLNAVSLSEVRNGCAALAIWLRVAACARTRRPSARQERLRGTQIIEDKWRKRVGVEPFYVLQPKDLPLELTVLPDTNLNFRTPIAHELARFSPFIRKRTQNRTHWL